MSRRLLALTAATAGLTVLLALPVSALAHTPQVSDSCSGLNVSLTSYEGPAANNRVTVTIDGAAQSFDFGGSFSRSFPWAQTTPHTWTVAVDANRVGGNPTQYDATFNGSEQPCQTPSTSSSTSTSTSTTSSTTSTTQPASTTSSTSTVPASSSSSSTSTPPSTTEAPTTAAPDTTAPCAEGESRAEDGTCVPAGYYDTTVVPPPTVDIGQPPSPPTPPSLTATLPATGAGYVTEGSAILAALFVWVGLMVVLAARRRGGAR